MRRIWKVAAGIVMVPVLGLALLGAVGQARWDRTFDVAEPELRASTDPAVIARGRYLAYGPAHCAVCHTPKSQQAEVDAGAELPLVGGHAWDLPFGTVYSPNLTPDEETGIGGRTDGQLARMLRHGVRHDGRSAVPFMEFQNMSDEDLVAVISFLRSQPPVRSAVPEHRLNAVGRMVMAYLIAPIGPSGTPASTAPPEEATVERGAYLVNNVAGCAACHSKRNLLDGSYSGPRLAGGNAMPVEDDPSRVIVSPNLTPDPVTGRIADWTEDQFVARFRAGRLVEGSHMPWGSYGRMSDTDLRAIFRFLRSLEPIENETGPVIQPAKR